MKRMKAVVISASLIRVPIPFTLRYNGKKESPVDEIAFSSSTVGVHTSFTTD